MMHKYSHIPLDHLRIYVDDCINIADYIVSVGSGDGTYEAYISKENPKMQKKLILVDPDSTSFKGLQSSAVRAPDYPYVRDLIKNKPEVVENCVLLLIWPPSDKHPKYSSYEMETIELLKPSSIISMYELPMTLESGASGSEDFATFIRKTVNDALYNYKMISTTRYAYNNIFPKICWIAKKGSQVPKTKKCLLLQELANKICGKDLELEKDYKIEASDVLKLIQSSLSSGNLTPQEILNMMGI